MSGRVTSTAYALADHNHDGHLDLSEFSMIRRAGTAFAEADFGYLDKTGMADYSQRIC